MFGYIVRRLLLMIPTFLGITLISFFIINLAPGGPVEQRLQEIRFGGGAMGGGESGAATGRGGFDTAVNEEIIEALRKQYGFDKPVHIRYAIWLRNIFTLDFGESFVYEEPVIDTILSKFPVSLQFGITSLILMYLICIPLGVAKSVKHKSLFDTITNFILNFMYAVPVLVLGIFLITIFAGGSYFSWFPIGGLRSDDYEYLSTWGKIVDRVHHFVLPQICYIFGSFTSLTMLMKNSMLEVVRQDYIRTARAKGLSDNVINYKHALRNALIPIATGLATFFGVFLAGSLIIETIFQLDGIGLLSYNSLLQRDYNVIMALIFLSSLVLLFGRLVSDITYVLIDPRIDFK